MLKNFSKVLGPGLLFASTAIGVSHLVQSTRAGADYGFSLLIFIVLANLLKYPFFEYGSRYANVTKTSLIDGYKKMGNWMLWLYILITVCSMFFVTAAVSVVTGGFMENLFGLTDVFSFKLMPTLIIMLVCTLILLVGKFSALNQLLKIVGLVLLLSTITAFIMAMLKGPQSSGTLFSNDLHLLDKSPKNSLTIAFIISLMGWMPTAIDLSAWNSLWTIERIKDSNYTPSLKETLFEFRVGYIISAVLSVFFLTLGAFMVFGTDTKLPESNAQFSHAIVALYTNIMGDWSYWIIAASAFSIMFSTCITVLDGYGRSFKKCMELIKPESNTKNSYSYAVATVAIVAFGVIYYFLDFSGNPKGFTKLIDFATALSFGIAPIVAIANFYLVNNGLFPKNQRPKRGLKFLSYVGIVFLIGFNLFFFYSLL
jgi:Mn2+/Fe2+ NRAMP family transporter